MEYSVNKLSKISGVSARTLRYYDELDLLKPARIASSGYRIYSKSQVDLLQQILFYRELGFPLDEIKSILYGADYDHGQAFLNHLADLQIKRKRLDVLIRNVTKTIAAMKGELSMTDAEKFEGFKQSLIDENEEKYGAEVRSKYGDTAMDEANTKVRGLSQEDYNESERLRALYEEHLKAAFKSGDPAGELAQKACDFHKEWLCIFYPHYSKEYHIGLGDIYVYDERFKSHYEKIAPGCTEFFRDAINIYCG